MWDMFINAVTLFVKGKLFRNTADVLKRQGIGIAIATIIMVVAVKLGAPLWLGAILASAVSGALQPYLFKDLKYA